MRALHYLPLAFITLAGCGGADRPEPIIRTVEVLVPTPVSCVPDGLAEAPTYPDTDEKLKAAGGADERYQLVAAGRPLRDARLKTLEPIVRGCRSPNGAPPSTRGEKP